MLREYSWKLESQQTQWLDFLRSRQNERKSIPQVSAENYWRVTWKGRKHITVATQRHGRLDPKSHENSKSNRPTKQNEWIWTHEQNEQNMMNRTNDTKIS